VRHYARGETGLRPLPRGKDAEDEMRLLSPAGGWTGTASDYLLFAQNPVPEGTVDRPSFIAPDASYFYGLAWRVWPAEDGWTLTHAGFLPGIFTLVVRLPGDVAVVMLFNGSPRDNEGAYVRLVQSLRDAARQIRMATPRPAPSASRTAPIPAG
jgi:hypothetical protein